ncbi:MAG TPA: endonuclease NucS domain-containing protein, partial [Bacteroidales bacterium]|nr:endonuclease NucS domain-containing protein [Bacteroidales bacterium]
MRIFTLNDDKKMIPYNEVVFKLDNKEIDLEVLLEKNPEYFFESHKILMIGRQVTTNLNSFIDLLGIDKSGNTVVIELKRDKTPRETIAQLLEYASFVDKLDYDQLNQIFQKYLNEEKDLEEYHQQYFQTEEQISFNKTSKLVIVAQEISKEIKQSALYLRGKGIEVFCMEFRYFVTKSNERIISSDFIVGEEEYLRQQVKSESLPKVNENEFINNLDSIGKYVFDKILKYCKDNEMIIRWG